MIIVDVETTGPHYFKHSITQIAAIELENPKNRFSVECRIFDGAEISEMTYEYNGYTDESLTDPNKITDVEACKAFLEWAESVKDKTIVGENPAFDRDFIRFTLLREDIEWPLGYRTIDIHTLAYSHHIQRGIPVPEKGGLSALRLDTTLEYVGLPTEPKPHTAINGALYEAEAVSRLLFKKPLLEEFKEYTLPDYV